MGPTSNAVPAALAILGCVDSYDSPPCAPLSNPDPPNRRFRVRSPNSNGAKACRGTYLERLLSRRDLRRLFLPQWREWWARHRELVRRRRQGRRRRDFRLTASH